MDKLREGYVQKEYDERLKNNSLRLVKHGISDTSSHCRVCSFGEIDTSLAATKRHAEKTGHTIDLYREHWTEITYYQKPK